MNILVIGGSRFIGYHLVRGLLREGHEVTVFNRGLEPDDFGEAVRRIRGDRTEAESFRRKLGRETFDAVADIVAYEAEESRVAAETFRGRIGHFIHISTGSVYTVLRDFPCPLREEDYDGPLMPRPAGGAEWWLYGTGKRGCEDALRAAFRAHGFPVTLLRLPVVQGERDYTLRAYSYFLRLEDGGPVILPDGGLCPSTYVYQADVVRAICRILGNPKTFGQAYNLAGSEIVTLRDFVLKAAGRLGRKAELVDIPWDLLKRTDLPRDFSPFSLRRPFVLSTDKARRELDFVSTPLDVWLSKTMTWFKKEYEGGAPPSYASRDREKALVADYRAAVKKIGRAPEDAAGPGSAGF